MKILVLNCGSSSIKYKLFDMTSGEVMAQGGIEKIGLPGAFLKLTDKDGKKVVIEREIPGHQEGIEFILSVLTDATYGCIKDYKEIDAVGHRVVHGGEEFASSVLINQDVINKVIECSDLAPLHNPANLKGVRAMEALIPGIPQVAVFDTAFHQTMPDYAYMYGLPYEMYKKYGVRRYGFHGTSHRYVSRRACEILGVPYEDQKIITAHVGNGGSITAIKNGKSVDTSMGLTPVEGLLMGTRCGDVDAGALSFIMDKEGMDGAGLSDLINKRSGVAGLSGISSDMREIEAAVAAGNPRAIMTLNVYNYRIKKYIGAYAAAMGGCDILVWTGGVGENQWATRRAVCENMEYMGMKIDVEKNEGMRGEEMVISTPDSKVTIIVVPTDEEFMIAADTLEIFSKKITSNVSYKFLANPRSLQKHGGSCLRSPRDRLGRIIFYANIGLFVTFAELHIKYIQNMAQYKRILLKLSGESLMGGKQYGIDEVRLNEYAAQIKEIAEMGVQIGIVIGGGNIFRGLSGASKGFDRVKGDQMGMLATVINSLALSSALVAQGVNAKVLTAIRMEPIGEFYNKWRAIELLEQGNVVIMSGGTGNPFFTTDTGSSLRGIEIEADVMLKGTRVDGIYTADPEKDPTATKFSDITYDEIYTRGLKVMDLTATTMCKENNLPIIVFDMDTNGNLKKVMSGENIGTLVHN